MGHVLQEIIEESDDLNLVGIIDVGNVDDFSKSDLGADVIIDFSNPAVLPKLSEYVQRTGTALVSGTTGYGDQGQAIKALGAQAPVIYAENYSIGINVMAKAVKQLSELMGDDFDVELIETHHRYKKDAPSGTAQLLIRAVDPQGKRNLVYGRSPQDGPRQKGDLGVHSLRGGTVPGDHTVGFYGEDEVMEISHRAFSRRIFAQGAIAIARKIVQQPNGSYTFEQLLSA